MKTFETFEEALTWQKEKGSYDVNSLLATGVENIDRVQFSLGNVFWTVMPEGYYLDDYEEWVTQYGVTASGEWAAVEGGHCSCFGWEEMNENDITYYPTLEVLLKADKKAEVILVYKDILKEVLPFLNI